MSSFYVMPDGTIQELNALHVAAMQAGNDIGFYPAFGPYDTEEDAIIGKEEYTQVDYSSDYSPQHPLEHPISVSAIAIIGVAIIVGIMRKVQS